MPERNRDLATGRRRYRSAGAMGSTKKKTLTLPHDLTRALEDWAFRNELSFNDLVGRVLREYLEKKQQAR